MVNGVDLTYLTVGLCSSDVERACGSAVLRPAHRRAQRISAGTGDFLGGGTASLGISGDGLARIFQPADLHSG
jgi:hypothetical protein